MFSAGMAKIKIYMEPVPDDGKAFNSLRWARRVVMRECVLVFFEDRSEVSHRLRSLAYLDFLCLLLAIPHSSSWSLLPFFAAFGLIASPLECFLLRRGRSSKRRRFTTFTQDNGSTLHVYVHLHSSRRVETADRVGR